MATTYYNNIVDLLRKAVGYIQGDDELAKVPSSSTTLPTVCLTPSTHACGFWTRRSSLLCLIVIRSDTSLQVADVRGERALGLHGVACLGKWTKRLM